MSPQRATVPPSRAPIIVVIPVMLPKRAFTSAHWAGGVTRYLNCWRALAPARPKTLYRAYKPVIALTWCVRSKPMQGSRTV